MSPVLAEHAAPYRAGHAGTLHTETPPFPEERLTALWLLGRVPAAALPCPVLRPGRAGRGPGPDVREATLLSPSGVPRTGDVEVHLRASDFVRHGHAEDPAYAGVVLHLCWLDDRPASERGTPTPLPGGGAAITVALAGSMRAADVEHLVALGPAPATATPCAGDMEPHATIEAVRLEGRRRLAERTWRAWRLADRTGFEEALALLLERAIASSAGRRREPPEVQAAHAEAILRPLGPEPLRALARLLRDRPALRPAVLIEAVRAPGTGAGRAAEVAWNAGLPLLAALAAASDDLPLARATARLAEAWPSPRPYGRTRSLAAAVLPSTAPSSGARTGALWAQGLLHLQDLWCSRGGCGACPLSPGAEPGNEPRS